MLKLLSAIVIMAISAAFCHRTSADHGIRQPGMVFLGEFLGKNYYHDPSGAYTRSDADDLCEMQGMQMVTITSPSQLAFIRSNVAEAHWTAAKATGAYMSTVNPAIIPLPPTWIHDNYITCLAVNDEYLFTDTCGANFHALCYM